MLKSSLIKKLLGVLAIALLLSSISDDASAASIDNNTRVALQSELRTYIGTKTNDGIYSFFDESKGSVQKFQIKAIHPVIFAKEDRFLLCADFIDQKGNKVLIDYVMLSVSDGFIVEKELEGQRSKLMTIFEKLL